ncbi:MAG: RluA family pseudouridine synthase [Bacteroidia bacterium]|nr:RluA family pseudouridine synthase [Bacteroidia bacterium]
MPEKVEKGGGRFIRHYSLKEEHDAYDPDSEDEEALHEHYTLTAPNGLVSVRVDKFLVNTLPQTSRSRLKNASTTGAISVNGQSVKVSYKVKPGDVVRLMLPFPPVPVIEAEPIPLDIRYEDQTLLIVYKPASMVVHPAIGHRTGTLVQGLMYYLQNLPKGSGTQEDPRPGLIHRIDKETTGILVIAKTEYAMAHLSKQFFDRTTDRLYEALVWGDVKEEEGRIEAHIGRNVKNRKIFQAFPDGSTGRSAVTHYRVLERFGVATLVQCKLETGRTHQIRVHMKHIGHPLMGDYDYGGDRIVVGPNHQRYQQMMTNCLGLLPGQALHAKTLSLTHPDTGERMDFSADMPENLAAILEKLRRWRDGRDASVEW